MNGAALFLGWTLMVIGGVVLLTTLAWWACEWSWSRWRDISRYARFREWMWREMQSADKPAPPDTASEPPAPGGKPDFAFGMVRTYPSTGVPGTICAFCHEDVLHDDDCPALVLRALTSDAPKPEPTTDSAPGETQ